jgi:hypothetical protein
LSRSLFPFLSFFLSFSSVLSFWRTRERVIFFLLCFFEIFVSHPFSHLSPHSFSHTLYY